MGGMSALIPFVDVREDETGVTFPVRVAPRASRTRVLGVHQGALKVALCAPPVDGKANAALIQFLSKELGVPKRALTLIRGQTGRDKLLRAEGLSSANVRALVEGL